MREVQAFVLAVCLMSGCSEAPTPGEPDKPVRTGPYLGEELPGSEPRLFAEGVVSTHLDQRDTAWTPEGDELLYSMWVRNRGVIVTVRLVDGEWIGPEIAPFSGRHSDLEPFITADGNELYFISKRPLDPGGGEKDWDIWVVRRTADGWGAPENLGSPVNTDGNEYYPSLSRDGTLYFTGADRVDTMGGEDLYRARRSSGGFAEPENLGPPINSAEAEYNAMISPDEDYLIFGSAREDDLGGGDMYISFRSGDGSWTEAVNMGEPVNTRALDFCPALSPDGRFLFFTSRRVAADAPAPASYRELVDSVSGPLNGSMNLYWITSDIIEQLRPTD
jgi:Tol biopolymer transport system component